MSGVTATFSSVERLAFFRELARLEIEEQTSFRPGPRTPLDAHGPELGMKGYAAAASLISAERANEMRVAIAALHRAGLPAVFAYVYDAFWEPLAALDPIARHELGEYDVLADAWAFLVPKGAKGWRPHRGIHEYEGERTTLNIWIALTHATTETSCMYIVPLDRDPAYPAPQMGTDIPAGAAVALEALPGTALLWDANALHWGGDMKEGASEPRASFTFTLRKTSRRRKDLPVLDLGALDFRARLDLIAGEILKYASMERVDESVLEWAKLTVLTRSMGSRLRGSDV